MNNTDTNDHKSPLKGVYITKTSAGKILYRASVTRCGRHISLGSYPSEKSANLAYQDAISILENTSELSAHNVRRLEDTGEGEYIIRYEDGNNITTSIYFSGECYCSVGFIDRDGKYRNFSTWARIDRTMTSQFFFDMAVTLHRCSDFAIDNYDR